MGVDQGCDWEEMWGQLGAGLAKAASPEQMKLPPLEVKQLAAEQRQDRKGEVERGGQSGETWRGQDG